ncbi:hypothetical protein HPB51_007975 [Rhipicephalus microplus]|uniref:Uncharacterized protein n=1 Tax=Rhipicephalus microplus TaxID=6941 RepID=A0A9J6EZH7_RHIMP|nr:hypothetical protein HPB51_007975 [Rhipicephalus microplus]
MLNETVDSENLGDLVGTRLAYEAFTSLAEEYKRLSLSGQEELLNETVDSENLGDLVGTRLAYEAFTSLPEEYKRVTLAGFNMSSERLFFINLCNQWSRRSSLRTRVQSGWATQVDGGVFIGATVYTARDATTMVFAWVENATISKPTFLLIWADVVSVASFEAAVAHLGDWSESLGTRRAEMSSLAHIRRLLCVTKHTADEVTKGTKKLAAAKDTGRADCERRTKTREASLTHRPTAGDAPQGFFDRHWVDLQSPTSNQKRRWP